MEVPVAWLYRAPSYSNVLHRSMSSMVLVIQSASSWLILPLRQRSLTHPGALEVGMDGYMATASKENKRVPFGCGPWLLSS